MTTPTNSHKPWTDKGGLFIEDLCALVAAADDGMQLKNAPQLLGLAFVEAEAIGEPLGAHWGGHGMGC
jgi:hypothetical protein